MQKISLTIRVDAAELERWRAQADGNLSAWIRGRCNAHNANSAREVDSRASADGGAIAAGGEVAKKRVPKTCPHGKSKGEHCWQCQGLAKVE